MSLDFNNMNNIISIKNLDKNILVRLRFEAKKQGLDLNAYVLSLIRKSLGIDRFEGKMTDKNNLSQLAGTWTKSDYDEFIKNTHSFNEVDKQLWQ